MSKLYIIATPIGNLADISLRALEVFKSVDMILCEDTRVSAKLLRHFGIKKPLLAYHQHSKVNQVNRVIELIKQGKDLALVSDAGTPGIQDPGNQLITQLVEGFKGSGGVEGFEEKKRKPQTPQTHQSLQIIPVPGPSAMTALLSVSGFPTDSFLFLGFLPKKKSRQKILKEIEASHRTVVFYESGHRIIKALEGLNDLISGRQIVIGRELTKKFETIYRGTTNEVLAQIKNTTTKGEFVVAINT